MGALALDAAGQWNDDKPNLGNPMTPIEREALSDAQIEAIAARIGSLSLHATRLHELGGDTTTIFQPKGLLEFARAILAASRDERMEQAAKLADAEVARLSATGEYRCALAVGIVAAMIRAQT